MTIGILVLSDSQKRSDRWCDVLVATGCQVMAGLDTHECIDVIVTDRDWLETPLSDRCATGEIGVVTVGARGGADVSLPSDATDRELCMATLLLGQIVRLRRQRNEDKRARRVLSHLALTDPLTGLPNRRAWDDEIVRRVGLVKPAAGPLCIALLDLDHFKRVNDEHGHHVGDSVLCNLGTSIVSRLRQDDFVARLGGDEFGVLLSSVEPETAAEIIERVRSGVGHDLSADSIGDMTVSAGLAIAEHDEPLQSVYVRADDALRKAKADGRDRVVCAG